MARQPENSTEKFVNLIFQGGGVRGIAYAGALSEKPPNVTIHSVAGTSAGSIVAGLLAIGCTTKELRQKLEDRELYSLLHPNDCARYQRIKSLFNNEKIEKLRGLFQSKNSFKQALLVGRQLWTNRKDIEQLLQDLHEIQSNRGAHGSELIRGWLDKQFGGKRFRDATAVEDFKIVAADLTKKAYVVYSKIKSADRDDSGKLIAEAVQESISIPLFFKPCSTESRLMVDGGILSNYPKHLFAHDPFPTIGFCLDDFEAGQDISSPLSYLKALLLTMIESHDKYREEPKYFQSHVIKVPNEIKSTKFNLSESEVGILFDCGVSTGKNVDWQGGSTSTPGFSYSDPQAVRTLDFTLKQTAKVLDYFFKSPDMWVEHLLQEVVFTVTVDRSWSCHYYREIIYTVEGEKELYYSRNSFIPSPTETSPTESYIDVLGRETFKEIKDGKLFEVIRVPAHAEGDSTRRRFLVFFTPPIRKGTPRKFYGEFSRPFEFERTLRLGKNEECFYTVRQSAHDHKLALTFRVYISNDLPKDIDVSPQFHPHHVLQAGEVKYDEESNLSCRMYEFKIPSPLPVNINSEYRVILSRSGQNS